MLVEAERETTAITPGRCQAGVVADDFGVAWSVEFVGAGSGDADSSEGEHDGSRRVDPDDLMIELIADQRVSLLQADGAGRVGIGDAAGSRAGDVFKNVRTIRIDFDDPVVERVGDQ